MWKVVTSWLSCAFLARGLHVFAFSGIMSRPCNIFFSLSDQAADWYIVRYRVSCCFVYLHVYVTKICQKRQEYWENIPSHPFRLCIHFVCWRKMMVRNIFCSLIRLHWWKICEFSSKWNTAVLSKNLNKIEKEFPILKRKTTHLYWKRIQIFCSSWKHNINREY